VLQPDGPVREHGHRLAFSLEIAVTHGHGRFFVATGEELGRFVAAVVDDRLVKAAEARAWIGADVFESE
jgi:hypothetical protein